MPQLSSLTLVDLVVAAVVVLAIAGALRRRSSLLGAAGSALGALVVSWLVVVALAAWGPNGVATAAADSRLLHAAPAPQRAVEQAQRLVEHVTS